MTISGIQRVGAALSDNASQAKVWIGRNIYLIKDKTGDAAQTVGTGIYNTLSKIISFVGTNLSKGLLNMKNGLGQGFRTTRTFVGAHQKETLIVVGVVTLALGLGYIARNVYNGSTESTI